MAQILKDLGRATAYAHARAGGYNGTRAEFEAAMARFPELDARVEILERKHVDRVSSLDETALARWSQVDAVGIPAYVEDVAELAAYGIEDPQATGWYIFSRIAAPAGMQVTDQTEVIGAAGQIVEPGADHVDVAVRFEVSAQSVPVTVNWGGAADTVVFRATDLAIRNLDYRVTFYVYDADPFAVWEYAPSTDAVFDAAKHYFLPDGNGGYAEAQVSAVRYIPTADATFAAGKTYYVSDGEGGYTAAEVTEGEAVPENTYFEQTTNPLPTAYYVKEYFLTEDETFAAGKTYYAIVEELFTPAEVTEGEPVPAETYYEVRYTRAQPGAILADVTYYTLSGSEYTAAEVTPGDPIVIYYAHSKLTLSGLTRNVTYRLNQVVDCPTDFILPEIEDDCHGAWFEIRFRHSGSFSTTLVPPDETVKIATEHTQSETAGINMVNLHYTVVDGVKIWRFLNTHASIPA